MAKKPQAEEEALGPPPPPEGSVEWIHMWAEEEGELPSPIDISITGAIKYACPPLEWYNFDVRPAKIKVTNTGYSAMLHAKWKRERPFLVGGPLLGKYIFSQVHFHWGANMMEGSDHSVDGTRHPMEMHVVFFKAEYLTQHEAFNHSDGVVILCYMIKYGSKPDLKLDHMVALLPLVREAQTHARLWFPRTFPLSDLVRQFHEDYFCYFGALDTDEGPKAAMWLVARLPFAASCPQILVFRSLLDPWDEPNLGNFRRLHNKEESRHIFLVCPHYAMFRTLLEPQRTDPESTAALSDCYQKYPPTPLPELEEEI